MSDLGIGQRAKERREQLGLSLQQVADRAGLTKSWLWDIEQGRNVNPTVNSTLCLARALGVPFGALVELSTTLPDLHPEALRIAIEVDAILRRQISPMEPNVGGSMDEILAGAFAVGEENRALKAEIERLTAERDAALAKLAQYEQAPVNAKTLFTYQRTFDAIAAAVTPNAVGLGISVKKFIEAFGPIDHLIARPEVTK